MIFTSSIDSHTITSVHVTTDTDTSEDYTMTKQEMIDDINKQYDSIAECCRQMGFNRTVFYESLAGRGSPIHRLWLARRYKTQPSKLFGGEMRPARVMDDVKYLRWENQQKQEEYQQAA